MVRKILYWQQKIGLAYLGGVYINELYKRKQRVAKMTLFGIYHRSAEGIVTLCESNGANYYEAAFHSLESAKGYAMQSNDQFKSQSYFAAPLAGGIVALWIADSV